MKLTLKEDLRTATTSRKLKIVIEMTHEEMDGYLLESGVVPKGMIAIEIKEVE